MRFHPRGPLRGGQARHNSAWRQPPVPARQWNLSSLCCYWWRWWCSESKYLLSRVKLCKHHVLNSWQDETSDSRGSRLSPDSTQGAAFAQPSGASIIPSSSATASRHGVPPPRDTSVRHGTPPCAGISSVPVPSLHHTKFHPCFGQPDWSRSALGPQNEALELLKKGMKKRKKKKHIQLKKGEKMIHASQALSHGRVIN